MLNYQTSASRKGIQPQQLGNSVVEGLVKAVKRDDNGVYGMAGGTVLDVAVQNKGLQTHTNVPLVSAGMWGMFGAAEVGDKVQLVNLSSCDGGEPIKSNISPGMVALGSKYSPFELPKMLMMPAVNTIGSYGTGFFSAVGDITRRFLGTGIGAAIVQEARKQLGKTYILGTQGPNTFDCSGLVWWVHHQNGIKFTRTTSAGLRNIGRQVQQAELMPGDTVIMVGSRAAGGSWDNPWHSGVYAGDGMMVHAAGSRIGVVETPISQRNDIVQFRRLW